MSGRPRSAVAPLAALLVAAACGGEAAFPSEEELTAIRNFLPNGRKPRANATNAHADDPAAAELGARLFGDPELSRCKTLACADCHPKGDDSAYTIHTRFPTGCFGGTVDRNVVSLLNSGFGEWFYWDGRKDSLWAHASLPLTRETEMAAVPTDVRDRLQTAYLAEYVALFGHEPAADCTSSGDCTALLANFGKAIEAYLRTLVRIDAPFDADVRRFLAAADAGTAETDPLFLGLKTFFRKGRCIACHKGPMLTDEKFHNTGIKQDGATVDEGRLAGIPLLLEDPLNGAGAFSDRPDLGATKILSIEQETDRNGAFKTPSLRNVALSKPYMHNGILAELDDVVEFYNRGGDPAGTFPGERTKTIGKLGLSDEEQAALVRLMESLTGSELP